MIRGQRSVKETLNLIEQADQKAHFDSPGKPFAPSHVGLRSVEDNIEIRNHSLQETLDILFAEEKYLRFINRRQHIAKRILGGFIPFEYEFFGKKGRMTVSSLKPIFGADSFFDTNGVLIDLGSGPGKTALQIAQFFSQMSVVGIDYEFGKQITPPSHSFPNLKFSSDNWKNLGLPSNSVDRIISTSAAFVYGRPSEVVPQLSRVAKVGALLRAQTMPYRNDPAVTSGDIDHPGSAFAFSKKLAENGWDVWYATGYHIIIAQKK